MGKQAEKDRMQVDAESQRRIAAAQEQLAGTTEQFGREDRETSKGIRDLLEPFAAMLRATYNPAESAAVTRPDRPDFSRQYEADYKNQLAGIEDDSNTAMADAADYATAAGLTRTGVPGMARGELAGQKAGLRTGARTTLGQQLTGEKEAGWMDKLQGYYDALNKRQQDVGIATTGANISAGQQATFNPNQWFGQTSGNLAGAGATTGNAAGTEYQSAQLPGTWARVGGALAGVANTASKFAPWFGG